RESPQISFVHAVVRDLDHVFRNGGLGLALVAGVAVRDGTHGEYEAVRGRDRNDRGPVQALNIVRGSPRHGAIDVFGTHTHLDHSPLEWGDPRSRALARLAPGVCGFRVLCRWSLEELAEEDPESSLRVPEEAAGQPSEVAQIAFATEEPRSEAVDHECDNKEPEDRLQLAHC